jgi:hypothetical protein
MNQEELNKIERKRKTIYLIIKALNTAAVILFIVIFLLFIVFLLYKEEEKSSVASVAFIIAWITAL